MKQSRERAELLELQRRVARSEQLAALGAMAARLAHELGTPLHSVAGHLELLLAEAELPDAARDRIGIVAREVDRLGRLIRTNLRRLRTSDAAVRPADVNALVASVLTMMQPVLDAHGITVQREFDPRAAEEFSCDAMQIEQALVNLIQNSIDAMTGGGTLSVTTRAAGRGRVISVADDGVGVAEEDQGRLFEPFFSTKSQSGGCGLGLVICREVARNHGGSIVLDSKPGLGAVVTLTLGPLLGEATA